MFDGLGKEHGQDRLATDDDSVRGCRFGRAAAAGKEGPLTRLPPRHTHCFVCQDGGGLGLHFVASGNGVRALFRADPRWQGYDGILHGGIISTLLDAAMTQCLFRHGIEAMTADLHVRFLSPVTCGDVIEVTANLLDAQHRLYRLAACLRSRDVVRAHASGKFLPFPAIRKPDGRPSVDNRNPQQDR